MIKTTKMCDECGREVQGQDYYSIGDKLICKECYEKIQKERENLGVKREGIKQKYSNIRNRIKSRIEELRKELDRINEREKKELAECVDKYSEEKGERYVYKTMDFTEFTNFLKSVFEG